MVLLPSNITIKLNMNMLCIIINLIKYNYYLKNIIMMLNTNLSCAKIYQDMNQYNKYPIHTTCGNISDTISKSAHIAAVELPTRTCIKFYSQINYQGCPKIICNSSYHQNVMQNHIGDLSYRVKSIQVMPFEQAI